MLDLFNCLGDIVYIGDVAHYELVIFLVNAMPNLTKGGTHDDYL